LRNKHQDPKTKSNLNTMYLQITLGENHGSGHFYFALTVFHWPTSLDRSAQDVR
jgi:hypothetical protein